MRSLGELRKAPRGKPVTAAARNVRKSGGLAERLKNHLVGAEGECPDHRRSLRRPFGESYRGTLDTLYGVTGGQVTRGTVVAVRTPC